MKSYTFTEVRRRLAWVLDQAARAGRVPIRRRGGQVFLIQPDEQLDSPLNVKGLKPGLTRKDILKSIQEGRRPF